ncbi:response regulator [Duganella violaceipulchra]|uniref:Virulence sensor protein BvgS n=1 Tax=Duganella violaceipulchra TaxID=2849652 RepID=A0AA41HFT0_9BURK|nr:response regulator [Duganella violaceicalia]MCP2007703.1 signal transduction histidine kinase/CheY-like chemotaxis protein [Duganella violaceicalia]
MRSLLAHSMFWKLFVPIGALLLLSALAAAVLLPLVIHRNAEQEAIVAGQETVRQFQLLRKYYTDNVVSKVMAESKLRISFDHLGRPDTVPLPATMILDLSALLKQSGTSLRLYSPYPFPNRRERVVDQFGEDAWTFLQRSPDQIFTRVETIAGKTVVRVAMADRMVAQACVSCHNSWPGSPRTNWKLGDVRGVLEVDSSRQLASGQAIVYQVLTGLALMLLLLAVFIRLFYQRSIAQPLSTALDAARALNAGSAEKVEAVEAIAGGNLEREITLARLPDIDRRAISSDEVGQLLRSVFSIGEAQLALDHAMRKMSLSLRASRDAEQARDWLKSGQNELNGLMRGEQETALLAEKVLRYLATRSGAGVGAFFLHDEQSQQLYLAAGYALPAGIDMGARIANGGGLLGQAVRERRVLLVDDVPAGYLPVGSALGRADPGNLMLVPLLHGDNLVGAIELAAFRAFRPAELDLLESVREALAVGFEVNQSRQRTKGLLAETEQQAEELRVQQEELQQTNEELAERADLLEAQREQLRLKHAELEQASRDMWRKAEELQKVSAYKSEFMANMSHELRTPLNSMLILSGLLKENKGQTLSPKQVEYASTINGAGQDLLNLINDILDLSKVEAGQVEFSYELVEPSRLCAELQDLFHLQAEQKGLRLHTEIAPDVPARVPLDAQRTAQILKNLIANAIKFTPGGEVGLRVSLADAAVNPLGQPALCWAVSDTGIGVPASKQDLIFEAFKQADGGISRQYGGTGLGLSISLQLARKMGGSLSMRSVEGQGSTFILCLPLAAPATPAGGGGDAAPSVPPPSVPPSAPAPMAAIAPLPPQALADDRATLEPEARCILIVEDDRNFAGILMDFVRQRGYAALVAVDGAGGVALARHYLPSAILLDVMLPGLDGWGVMRSLKDSAETRHIPVHFITCLEERQRAMEMGAIGLVTKPVSAAQLDEVLGTVESALDHSLKQLLIVEDNPAEAASLKALLGEREVVLTVAASGREAMALLAAGRYDCMVLDLGLADMSGFELLEHIQGMEQARRIPVIIHSGRDLTREQERQLQRYAERIIIKGAKSPERLLNEVTLFLHMVESKMEPSRQRMIRAAIDKEAMLDGKTVLIVDDDMRNIFSLTSLLSEKGMLVLEADNGREALLRLDQHPAVSVVLMDIMMPEMDGYEAMRRIRADRRYAALPIIAMTAKVMQGDQQKCLEAGASDYLAKPIDTDKLMSLLRVWTSR